MVRLLQHMIIPDFKNWSETGAFLFSCGATRINEITAYSTVHHVKADKNSIWSPLPLWQPWCILVPLPKRPSTQVISCRILCLCGVLCALADTILSALSLCLWYAANPGHKPWFVLQSSIVLYIIAFGNRHIIASSFRLSNLVFTAPTEFSPWLFPMILFRIKCSSINQKIWWPAI